jgi:adenylate cyclase
MSIAFSFAATFAFLFVLQMSRLVGGRTLAAIVRGRYHHPHAEDRFFLFVDIAGSTAIAERLGPAATHRYLSRVFRVAADPITDHRGEIYQYVGDEVVVTWTRRAGALDARPIACFFAIDAALAEAAPVFVRDFATPPRVRASLHAGPVIAGEVGDEKREIVFHGDVMNTASRLEHLAGELEHRLLASADAVNRLDAVDQYALRDVGTCSLRGRQQAIRVYAVEPLGEKTPSGMQ